MKLCCLAVIVSSHVKDECLLGRQMTPGRVVKSRQQKGL